MGKSSRNNLAAELEQSEGEADDGSSCPGVLQGQDEFSNDGLVVLDARRRLARTESTDARRRSSRSKAARTAEPNDIGEQIGAQLRSLYDDVLKQPIPDRFLELLNKLETDNISPPRSRAPGER
ncbi:MAG: hypothetical protein C3F11_06890 [Methylocystaceae bacterium]|nr:MAG: hypothetical protein C3F11_06890 [Methylocystaceae bacterium]